MAAPCGAFGRSNEAKTSVGRNGMGLWSEASAPSTLTSSSTSTLLIESAALATSQSKWLVCARWAHKIVSFDIATDNSRAGSLIPRLRNESVDACQGKPFQLWSAAFEFAGVAQLVEHQLPKLRVAGSNPVSRSKLRGSKGHARFRPEARGLVRGKRSDNSERFFVCASGSSACRLALPLPLRKKFLGGCGVLVRSRRGRTLQSLCCDDHTGPTAGLGFP